MEQQAADSEQRTTANEPEQEWPSTPSAILIMGKRQGTKRENRQLWGRVAMAAALWYSAPTPKPSILFVASDTHVAPTFTPASPGTARPDAELVRELAVAHFGIPADFVITRRSSNCTLLEVRAARVLSRAYRLTHIFAVTHLYHAPRAQRYLDEVLPHAYVIPVHPDILDEIVFPPEAPDLLADLRQAIETSLPGRLDQVREYVVEWLLNAAHTLDRRGRLERRLARLLRKEF